MSSTSYSPHILLRRRVRQIHRWLGLIVGIQVTLWIFGGLVMSSFAMEDVHGDPLRRPEIARPLDAAAAYLPPSEILQKHAAKSIQLRYLLNRAVYEVHGPKPVLLDALTGEVLNPIAPDMARLIALSDYAGDGELVALDWITEAGLEYRGRPLPLWRASFNDDLSTSLYISPDSGKVVARRNRIWRIFDFVWMLHIMDYTERDNFHHPLLISFAASALAFAVSGLAMLWFSFHRHSRSPQKSRR